MKPSPDEKVDVIQFGKFWDDIVNFSPSGSLANTSKENDSFRFTVRAFEELKTGPLLIIFNKSLGNGTVVIVFSEALKDELMGPSNSSIALLSCTRKS